jgi:hypothetical protein
MTKLCARGKAAAKRKFKVYPSAYANAYASKICAGKIKDPSGKKRKDWGPKKANKGGYFDEQKTNVKGKNKTGPMPGGKTPQIPGGEYMKYKKLKKNKVVSAKVGKAITAGGESAIGRLEKSGMLKAYTGRAVRQPSETDKEFEMRHEYHTPFKKPQKAKGGGIAIKGTNFKGVF